MATHSSVLAWRIPGTGKPGGLPSMGSHRVGHDWSDLAGAAAATLIILGLSSHDRKTFYIYLGLFHFFQCFVVFSVVFVQSLSCPALCDSIDHSPPGPSVHGTSQARILELVAISFSRGSSQPRDQTHVFYTGRRVLYHRTTWEALVFSALLPKSLGNTAEATQEF